jgi:hypothetical protein
MFAYGITSFWQPNPCETKLQVLRKVQPKEEQSIRKPVNSEEKKHSGICPQGTWQLTQFTIASFSSTFYHGFFFSWKRKERGFCIFFPSRHGYLLSIKSIPFSDGMEFMFQIPKSGCLSQIWPHLQATERHLNRWRGNWHGQDKYIYKGEGTPFEYV